MPFRRYPYSDSEKKLIDEHFGHDVFLLREQEQQLCILIHEMAKATCRRSDSRLQKEVVSKGSPQFRPVITSDILGALRITHTNDDIVVRSESIRKFLETRNNSQDCTMAVRSIARALFRRGIIKNDDASVIIEGHSMKNWKETGDDRDIHLQFKHAAQQPLLEERLPLSLKRMLTQLWIALRDWKVRVSPFAHKPQPSSVSDAESPKSEELR